MELNTVLLLFVALLILASLLQRLAERTTLPASILLAAAGAVIGGAAIPPSAWARATPSSRRITRLSIPPRVRRGPFNVFLPVLPSRRLEPTDPSTRRSILASGHRGGGGDRRHRTSWRQSPGGSA
jgi:hypothetical protein